MYEGIKIPLVSNYLPDFFHPERKIAVEVKGKAETYDQIKMFSAANAVGIGRLVLTVSEQLLANRDVARAIADLRRTIEEAGFLYQEHVYPEVKKIIVCPILSDTDLAIPSRWKGASGSLGYRFQTLAGIRLVGWLNANGIPHAPISQRNTSQLLKAVG